MPPKHKCPGRGEDKFTTNRQLTNHQENWGQDKGRRVVPVNRPNAFTADVGGSKRIRSSYA